MPTDEEWSDADMLADEVTGRPIPRAAIQGLTDMRRRIKTLEARLTAFHARPPADLSTDADDEVTLVRQLNEARARLVEYQTQLDGRN